MTKAMEAKMKKIMAENKKLKAMMKKKKMMGGGMAKGTKYKAAGGGKMPMVMKDGKKIPAFAADGKGKMRAGGKASKYRMKGGGKTSKYRMKGGGKTSKYMARGGRAR